MDTYKQPHRQDTQKKQIIPRDNDRLYADWFRVSGDLDDFIFYGEDAPSASTR